MNWAIIIGIIVVLIIYWLSAKEFETIARMKGHQGYFWWCFFLGIAGWLMVVALPDQKTRGELLDSVQKLSKNDTNAEKRESNEKAFDNDSLPPI